MPPKVKLAGLILLLACPAGVVAQTAPSSGIAPFSSDTPAGQSDRSWVSASTPGSPPSADPTPPRRTEVSSMATRLAGQRNRKDPFESPGPANTFSDDLTGSDSTTAPNATPATSPGIAPPAESLPGDGPPKKRTRSYPPMTPPGKRDSAATGDTSGPFGGMGSLATVGGSLGLVLGLFLIMAWIMRRAVPGTVQALPGDVMEVLGRAPLTARQQVHLVRIGSKLILVSVTPEGAETLTEITDAQEVDRLAGLCREAHPGSATNAFRHVFGQLARQRTESDAIINDGELDLSGMNILQAEQRGAGERR